MECPRSINQDVSSGTFSFGIHFPKDAVLKQTLQDWQLGNRYVTCPNSSTVPQLTPSPVMPYGPRSRKGCGEFGKSPEEWKTQQLEEQGIWQAVGNRYYLPAEEKIEGYSWGVLGWLLFLSAAVKVEGRTLINMSKWSMSHGRRLVLAPSCSSDPWFDARL